MLHIDFETRSAVDLKRCGAHRYARDASTDIICMAYAFDQEPVELWLPGSPFPARINQYVEDGNVIYAFNSQFERLIWWYVLENDYGASPAEIEQFYCVAAQCRVNGLPGDLASVGQLLNGAKKDFSGAALIKALCIPQEDGTFNEDPDLLEKMYSYCKQDVVVERSIMDKTRLMTVQEAEDFYVNEHINDRGIFIDRPFAQAAVLYAADEQREILGKLKKLTEGAVEKARGTRLTQWVFNHLPEEFQKEMVVHRGNEARLSFARDIRLTLLAEEKLPPMVRRVIELADDAQASSTAKFKIMDESADPETDRVCGTMIFSGAVSTGRFAGRRVQFQNMPRDGFDDGLSEIIRGLCIDGASAKDLCTASDFGVMQTLKRMLRYNVQAAPGNVLVCSDWAAIEGRALPWLADTQLSQVKLDKWRTIDAGEGPDIYEQMAAVIFQIPVEQVTKLQRLVGKVAELALGYGGGVGAFQAMAKGYGVSITDQEADRIKLLWREENPWAKPFWDGLKDSAIQAIRNPGHQFECGRITYVYAETFLEGALLCVLPSGRVLTYPMARVDEYINKFDQPALEVTAIKAAFKPKAGEKDWPRVRLWPGLLAENVTQACCLDLLREALYELSDNDSVIAHVHDEIMLEVPEGAADTHRKVLEEVMTEGPVWAEGLPLQIETWTGKHYRK